MSARLRFWGQLKTCYPCSLVAALSCFASGEGAAGSLPCSLPWDTSGEDSLSLCVLSVFGSHIAKGSALPGDRTPTLTVGAEGVDTLPSLALAGSTASSTDTHFPNGSPGYAVSCSSQEMDVPPKATRWTGQGARDSAVLSTRLSPATLRTQSTPGSEKHLCCMRRHRPL